MDNKSNLSNGIILNNSGDASSACYSVAIFFPLCVDVPSACYSVTRFFVISFLGGRGKHLVAAAQAKREQAHSATLPHSVSIEETKNSIPFISSPSQIWGSSSDHSSPLQLHLDAEET